MLTKNHQLVLPTVLVGLVLSGCTAAHYQKSADKDVYGVLNQKQARALGRTNDFSIDTEYSKRSPDDIKPAEILEDRLRTGKTKPSLSEALKLAVDHSRAFQLRKENLYLSALTLTRDRYDFQPHLLASTLGNLFHNPGGDKGASLGTDVGGSQLLKSGASLTLNIANDLVRYFTGDPRRSAITTISANFAQPLLRGAGADIVAENLTQSERNVIYEVRSFSRFQDTFSLDIISTYYRLLQQRDTVRNEYNNYQSLILVRNRVEALIGRGDFSQIQVDQARQDELSAKNRYIFAVQSYQNQLDGFKNTLALPLGTDLDLDDSALKELTEVGLISSPTDERRSYDVAVKRRLDVINQIDQFEDSQRKVHVAVDQLRAELNIVADASLPSRGPTDYSHFSFSDAQASVGLQLNLPIDRLRERNTYRASLINFERQLRTLAQFLDDVREDVLSGMRNVKQAEQSYTIQKNAVDLANRRVESATLLLQAGRVQIRDLLEAQNDQVQARNALTQNLVDYHLARLRLLIDLGLADTGQDHFWLKAYTLDQTPESPAPGGPQPTTPEEVVPPDVLFGKK